MFDEDKLQELCEWTKLEEVPDLPFNSFEDLIASINDGEYAMDLSYTAARELARIVRTPFGQIINLVLLVFPWIVIAAVIAASFWIDNYFILFGIPIALLAHFLGNPMMPAHNTILFMVLIGVFVFLYTLWQGQVTVSWLFGSAIFSFFSNRLMYRSNLTALKKAAKKSETLFLYLYGKVALRLRNIETGKEYWSLGRSA
ncbi:MAG: hypothetical protein IIA77_01430 [Proteobacteria bacterium]|nr:hypothetical protein [Pseudomonadota bacterium]